MSEIATTLLEIHRAEGEDPFMCDAYARSEEKIVTVHKPEYVALISAAPMLLQIVTAYTQAPEGDRHARRALFQQMKNVVAHIGG